MEADKLVKTLSGRNAMLTPHIDRFLADQSNLPAKWSLTIHNRKEKRDYGEADVRFSPSSDTLLTVEELVQKYTVGTPEEPVSAALRRTFDCGTMWHEYIENVLLEMKFIEESGLERYMIKKIERPSGIAYTSGLGDLVGVEIPGSGKWLVDVKTMNSRSFQNPFPGMMEKYIAQINLYGDWFEYDKLMILAIRKDSPHDFKEIIVPPNPELVESIYERWIEAYSQIKEYQANLDNND